MTLTADASGVFTIAATPFLPGGEVDYASVDRLTDFYLAAGVTGITMLGLMGEAQKLEPEESIRIVRQSVRRAGGVPVVVGVTAPGFAAMRRLAGEAMEAGAAGVMVAPPSSLRTDDQIVGYYANAVEAIGADVPFVLQDFPLVFGVVMSPGVIRRIIEAHPSCVMLKHEDWPGLEKISALRRMSERGGMRRVSILCGNGGMFLDLELPRGADGAMTGYAFPEMLVDLARLSKAGDRRAAQDLFDAHLPLIRYEQQQGGVGLAARKYVLQRRGAVAHDTQRRPGQPLSPEARAEVDFLLARLAERDSRADLAAVA